MENVLEKLINKENLNPQEVESSLLELLNSQNYYQLAAFLVLLRAKGETAEELTGMVNCLLKKAISVNPGIPVLDIVGTGGDKSKTVNISTGAAILAAACGVPIAKNGNRSSSSLCGSADVLEALGIKIEVSPADVERSIREVGIGFMFAPQFHPIFKEISMVRKSLRIPTAFNLLGPLLNPAKAEFHLLGVYKPSLVPLLADVLRSLGTRRSFVFHSQGLDELSSLGPASGILVEGNSKKDYEIDPIQFGLQSCSLEDLQGGDAQLNAKLLLQSFTTGQGAIADALALNAGAACWLYGLAETPKDGFLLAQRVLKEGDALKIYTKWKNHE